MTYTHIDTVYISVIYNDISIASIYVCVKPDEGEGQDGRKGGR